MAARINKRHSDEVRAKIQASLLVNRLQDCAMGNIELSSVQVKAIEALLDRSVPKLSQIQHIGDEDQPVRLVFGWMNSGS